MSDIELIRQIDRLEKRLDALIFPEISKGGGGDPATIDISPYDFYSMAGFTIPYELPPDDDTILANVYPYTGTHTGSTITAKLYWTDANNVLAGDIVLQASISVQSAGEILELPPTNTDTETVTVPGVAFTIILTTFTFTETYEPDDIIDVGFGRLGTDSRDTCEDGILPLCAKIIFS
jgi:hypothetical protein